MWRPHKDWSPAKPHKDISNLKMPRKFAKQNAKRIRKSRHKIEVEVLRAKLENPLDDSVDLHYKLWFAVNTIDKVLAKVATSDLITIAQKALLWKDVAAQELASLEMIDRLSDKKKREALSVNDLARISEVSFKRSQILEGKPTELVWHWMLLSDEQKALIASRYVNNQPEKNVVIEINNQEEENIWQT